MINQKEMIMIIPDLVLRKFSDDLKAYKQNQEIIAKNTKIVDYHKNTLASIASRDENGKFDPEKYKANFKEEKIHFILTQWIMILVRLAIF